ncbi:MAG: FKBP-type peptidyl-prolyl cis-trans isomerase [Verrucomicrobiota bacterium]
MKLALTAGLALALAGNLLAETPASNVPKETKDKVSYSIGADIGNNLKKSQLELSPDFLAQGIRDSFAGKTVMTEEEMKATLTAFQTEMQGKMEAKQKAAAEKNKAASEKFLAENKTKEGVKTTPSGLQYKVITEGKGPKPKADDTVVVHYRGTLTDGTEFDSSYKRNEPATFPVTGVIPGWTEALQMMPVGSKWQIVIPPALAYGENAPPMIGPNQALIFEVELKDIKKPETTGTGATPAAK